MTRTSLIVAAAIAISSLTAIGSSVTAHAATDKEDSLSVSVNYADLDLRTAGGHAMLDRRLTIAARKICQRLNPGAPLAEQNACVSNTHNTIAARFAGKLGGTTLAANTGR